MSETQVTAAELSPPSERRRLRFYQRLWFRAILYVVFAYVAWCCSLYLYQDRILFPADLAPEPRPQPVHPDTVVARRDLPSGGQVESWFIPAPSVGADSPGPVVVFFHGNAETIDYQGSMVRGYHRLGVSVSLLEYRGYGRSAGQPSQEGIVADAIHFYDRMLERHDVDRSRIVIHGRSLGGGVAAQVAARREPAALILESTFTSAAIMAHGYGAPAFLARHPFHTDRVVRTLDLPMLIFHGTDDSIIPVEHGRTLRDLAADAVYVEYPSDHNEFPGAAHRQAYWTQIETLLKRARIFTEPQPAHEFR